MPTFADSLRALLLQAKDGPRKDALFGDGFERAYEELPPFMVGSEFPDVYLEFPLADEPFLDATVLLRAVEEGTRIDSPRALGTEPLIDWYSRLRTTHGDISFGYEIDTATPEATPAGIHFQPRAHLDTVHQFCEIAGEPRSADLYLAQNERMPEGWDLSFFGMFRGRPGSPLRVCGYLPPWEQEECARNSDHLRAALTHAGFSAFDDKMLHEVSALLGAAPGTTDFQLDVYPDGSLGDVFSIDARFGVARADKMVASFTDGPAASLMGLLESWGTVDDRWRLVPEATFTRSLPVETDDGGTGTLAFVLMPQWIKTRWRGGRLQPTKIYVLARIDIT